MVTNPLAMIIGMLLMGASVLSVLTFRHKENHARLIGRIIIAQFGLLAALVLMAFAQ